MKICNLAPMDYIKRLFFTFSTFSFEAFSIPPFIKIDSEGSVINKRLGLLLALVLFATAIPFLPLHGNASARIQGNQQGKAPDKFHKSKNPVRDQYIVVLKDDTADKEIELVTNDLAARHGGGVGHIYKHAFKGFVARMPESAAMALSQDPRVEFVEEDGLGSFASQQWVSPWGWNLARIDQQDYPNGSINDLFYNYSGTGAGVHVYVIDTGIRTTHQEFEGRATRDFDALGGNGDDCYGHGTHVAGIIGGSTHGVAKGVRLHGIRIGVTDALGNIKCGGDNAYYAFSSAIAGIDWVTANRIRPAVATMSFAGGTSNSLDKAVRNCIAAGVTVVVAAGNGNTDASNVSPARVEEAITVSATDNLDKRGPGGILVGEGLLANYGRVVDLFAPGVNIESTWNTSDTATLTTSGTSMAAAHVAGVAAQFLQANPTADPDAVQGAIKSFATLNHVVDPGTDSPNRLLYSSISAALVSETTVTVHESDFAAVNTGVDLHPGEWATISATGDIWSGILPPIVNGPEGLDFTPGISDGYPLPGARAYSLIGFLYSTPTYYPTYFYIGRSNTTRSNITQTERLFLTINDNVPANGLGSFTCRIQVWKRRPSAAIFIGQNVPTVMTAGQTTTLDVSMFNSGETTWNTANNFWLGSQNPQDNMTWGKNRVPLPNSVPPGSQIYIPFTITAPTTPGTYNFRWRMVQDGVEWFGDLTDNIPITVIGNNNQAQFVSQTVKTQMTAFEPYEVSIKMKNTGNTTWQAGTGYKLGSQNLQDNTRWGTNRVALPYSVSPGQEVTFTFTVTAPPTAGTYDFQWRMLKEGVEWFGDFTTNVKVSVKPPVTG